MYAKLITPGDGCPPPPPGSCVWGDAPTADCIFIGGIPWGRCDKGAG